MLFHCYSQYETTDPPTALRQQVARLTWKTQLWFECPVRDADLPRLWEEEGRTVPFVVDLFDAATKGKADRDALIYTNADICVVSDCALQCAAMLQDTDAFYSFRRDFDKPFSDPLPDTVVPHGASYAGSDLYGFRVAWWRVGNQTIG